METVTNSEMAELRANDLCGDIEYSLLLDCYIDTATSRYGRVNGEILTGKYLDDNGYVLCVDDDEYRLEEDCIYLEDTKEYVSYAYDYQTCDECGYHYSENYDMEYIDGHSYCEDCAPDHREYIYDYHCYSGRYCPRKLNDEKPLYLGFELEVDNTRINDETLASYVLDGDGDNVLHCEYDSTVAFEFISQPCTLAYHKNQHYNDWFLSELVGQCESHDAGTCGLHVHVNKDFFTEKGYARLKTILFFFKEELFQFSRRQSWSYTYADFEERINKENVTIRQSKSIKKDGHQTWFNEYSGETYEFRFFRGTLKYETFMSALELVHNICTMAMSDVNIITWDSLLDGDYCREYSESRDIYCDSELNFSVLEERDKAEMTMLKNTLKNNVYIKRNYICVGAIENDYVVFYALHGCYGEIELRPFDKVSIGEIFGHFNDYGYYNLCNRETLSDVLDGMLGGVQ